MKSHEELVAVEVAERRFGPYRLLACIGRGGMASVYAATRDGQPIGSTAPKILALKALHAGLDDESRKSFARELELAMLLEHPNVVRAFEVVEHGHELGLVMERLDGATLKAVLPHASADLASGVPFYVAVLAEALLGIEYAHRLCAPDGSRLGIVHRDLTPSNVFVTLDGSAKVLDFGVAKADLGNATRTGIIKGTLRYLAPETLNGAPPDPLVDVYAVGVQLYELLAGRRMFDGLGEPQVLGAIVNKRIPRLDQQARSRDPDLALVVDKATAPEPEHRYRSALELRAALLRLSRARGVSWGRDEIGAAVRAWAGDTIQGRRDALERLGATFARRTDLDSSDLSRPAPPPSSGYPPRSPRPAIRWRDLVAVTGWVVAIAVGAAAGDRPAPGAAPQPNRGHSDPGLALASDAPYPALGSARDVAMTQATLPEPGPGSPDAGAFVDTTDASALAEPQETATRTRARPHRQPTSSRPPLEETDPWGAH